MHAVAFMWKPQDRPPSQFLLCVKSQNGPQLNNHAWLALLFAHLACQTTEIVTFKKPTCPLTTHDKQCREEILHSPRSGNFT